MTPLFSISPRIVTKILILAVLGFTIAGILSNFIEYFVGHESIVGTETFVELFDLGGEGNIPTWYATITLLLCSFLLATIFLAKKRQGDSHVTHWMALSIIFLYISIDEAGEIHEKLTYPLRTAFHTSGFLYYPAVIPGIAFLLIFVIAYRRFLAGLPLKTRRQFLLAGAVFVGGAIGVEMLGASYISVHGGHNLTYSMITVVEEFLEMLGVIVFIRALVMYLSSHVRDVLVRFDSE